MILLGAYPHIEGRSDLSERVHHLKILIRIKPGCDERDVWPLRERLAGLEKLKVQADVNPRKKPYVTEMGKLLRWVKKMNVTEGTTLFNCKHRKHWRHCCDFQNVNWMKK